MKKSRVLALLLAAVLLLAGCAKGSDEQLNTAQIEETETVEDPEEVPAAERAASLPFTAVAYAAQAGGFLGVSYDQSKAVSKNDAHIDTSHVAEGYVAVSAKSPNRLKFQVIFGTVTYNYDMKNDGTVSYMPLQSGNGSYKFRVMKNVSDNKYAEINSTTADVKLKDAYQPFLRPNDYAKYTQDSACVKKSAELCKNKKTDLERVSAVYDYVCKSIKYDRQLAATVKSGYLPDPDSTMASGKGICFDYASLAAAMLRSQGIPTKIIFGYVSPDGLYHAWNMFYTEETGWVTVSWQVSAKNWTRMDLTFSANGADDKFVGNGGNYKDVYVY